MLLAEKPKLDAISSAARVRMAGMDENPYQSPATPEVLPSKDAEGFPSDSLVLKRICVTVALVYAALGLFIAVGLLVFG